MGGGGLLRIHDLDADTTAIEIITGDAPYLVDSVRAELVRRGIPPERVLHPQLVVSRDAEGRLSQVYDIDDNAAVPAARASSRGRTSNSTTSRPTSRKLWSADLRRVLDDVHHAVQDAPSMYRLIRELADRLIADPGEFDRETSEEAGALLRWLADGNYMILGPRGVLRERAGQPHRACAGRRRRGRAARRRPHLTARAAAGVPQRRPTGDLQVAAGVDGAPLGALRLRHGGHTGHRPRPQRVHVFLGLITNAEDGTVGRVPVVRRRIAEILLRSGVRADSHTGRRLLAAIRTLPRDELLEAPTADLLRLAQLVVDRAENGTVGVFGRIHLNRDFVSVLVYFPADRFGPETRRRVTAVINQHWPGEIIGRDDRIVELNLARMQFLIAVRPGTQPPRPTGRPSRPRWPR